MFGFDAEALAIIKTSLGLDAEGTAGRGCEVGWLRMRGVEKDLTYCGWTKLCPILNHGRLLIVGIYRGITIPGFLRWCRIMSIHNSKRQMSASASVDDQTMFRPNLSCTVD